MKQNQSIIHPIENPTYVENYAYCGINGGKIDKSVEMALMLSMLHDSANDTLKKLRQSNQEMRTAIKALSDLYDGKLEDI